MNVWLCDCVLLPSLALFELETTPNVSIVTVTKDMCGIAVPGSFGEQCHQVRMLQFLECFTPHVHILFDECHHVDTE